jgi:hypothetical protein
MRITITQGTLHRRFVFLAVVILFGSVVFPLVAAAPLQPLFIEVYDHETSNALQTATVFEGKSYDIVIGTEEDIVVNVTITFSYDPMQQYVTSNETPFITIRAPLWDNYRTFVINASKPGYQSVQQVFTVMKGALSIRMDSNVKEKEEFQVTVQDQDNLPVEGALVFIDPDGIPITTDAQGIAYLDAPEVTHDKGVTIKTAKDGYINSSATILVESVEAHFP